MQCYVNCFCQCYIYVMAHKKLNLPTKICEVCQRPFSWRKKWKKDWEHVKYCSDRCRGSRSGNSEKAIITTYSSDGKK